MLWKDGTLLPILPEGQIGSLTDVSDSGFVVGTASGGPQGYMQLYRWRSGVLTLGSIAGGVGRVNNNGDVPFQPGATLYPMARVWFADGGTSSDFGTWHRYSVPRAINDSGTVVGAGERWPGTRAYLAHKSDPYHADSIGPSDATSAVDIDNRGRVIGGAESGPFLWESGNWWPIADLLATPDWVVTSVMALTDEGRILALARQGSREAFVVLVPRP